MTTPFYEIHKMELSSLAFSAKILSPKRYGTLRSDTKRHGTLQNDTDCYEALFNPIPNSLPFCPIYLRAADHDIDT
jgi:hypothetical protein